MKKIATFLAAAAIAILPTAAIAKTVTFTTNVPEAVTLYTPGDYTYHNFTGGNSLELTLGDDEGVQVMPNSTHIIDAITVTADGETNEIYANQTGQYVGSASMPDGCTVDIVLVDKPKKIVTVIGNPDEMSFTENYSNVYDASNIEDGKWTVELTSDYAPLQFTAKDGYVFTSAECSSGATIAYASQLLKDYLDISLYSLNAGDIITVKCGILSELRDIHVKVEVADGTLDQFRVQRTGEYTYVPTDEYNDIALYSGELPLTITPSDYSMPLYKVEVNGVAQSSEGSSFRLYDLKDGDVITVYPNFPDIDVPVSFSFTNEDTEDVITRVTVNNEPVDKSVWSSSDFSVKLGSKLGISYNTDSYKISSITINGEPNYNYYGYSETVKSEEPLNFVITAEKLRDYEITLYYEPNTIDVKIGYSDEYELSETGEDHITVAPNTYLYITAKEGYYITEIINQDEQTVGSPIYVTSDMELSVYTDAFVRDQQVAVYLDNLEDESYTYAYITLSYSNYDFRKQVDLTPGYNFVEYSKIDTPFSVAAYPYVSVYLDGQMLTNSYGMYYGTENLPDNSVLKLFPDNLAVPTYEVNIEGTELAESIFADYLTPVTSDYVEAFGPTDIVITVGSRDDEPGAIVTLNNETLEADEEGRYIAHITSDSTIKLTASETDGITDIRDNNKDNKIYNLQGMPVSKASNGIFIVNGKKVVIR